MAKKAGFAGAEEKFHELVFEKIFAPLQRREKDPVGDIPFQKLWDVYVLAHRSGLNPLYGQIYAAVYFGEIVVDLTAKGYLSALINNKDYLSHKMNYSDTKVECPVSHHIVHEWCSLSITFRDGRVIEGLPEFFLENRMANPVWGKNPSRMNAMKALTRGVAFALSLDCGEDAYVENLELGKSTDVCEQVHSPIIEEEEPQVDYNNFWNQFVVDMCNKHDSQLVNNIVDRIKESVRKKGKELNFTSEEQLSETKRIVTDTIQSILDNAKNKANHEPKQQEQEPVKPTQAEEPQFEEVEEPQFEEVETVQLEQQEVFQADVIESEPVEEVKEEEAQEPEQPVQSDENQAETIEQVNEEDFSEYDFSVIASSVRFTIDRLAEIAEQKKDRDVLLNFGDSLKSELEQAYVRYLVQRCRF